MKATSNLRPQSALNTAHFESARHRRGVDEHPHGEFNTVTLPLSVGIEPRDSAGGGGLIGARIVQGVKAGAGLLHEERHST
jgi:redox-sensitive bicupin YhaK (pirin superfamily)